MLENIEVLCHSSIRFSKKKIIYFDPFKIEKNYNDADVIFITHDHYDHYSEEDIDKVVKEGTIIVAPEDLLTKLLKKGFERDNMVLVTPNQKYTVKGIEFQTIPAYNVNKQFHPKANEWVGYVLKIEGVTYYIAGDTDITEENKKVKCDVAFVPVGGTFTMDYKEAAELINEIKQSHNQHHRIIKEISHIKCLTDNKMRKRMAKPDSRLTIENKLLGSCKYMV